MVDEKNKVYSVITRTGDTTIFNKIYSGKITSKGVVGLPQIRVPNSEADSITFNQKTHQTVWKEGKEYEFISQDSVAYVCFAQDTVLIPLSEIAQMQVKQFNKKATIFAVSIPVASYGLLIGLTILAYNTLDFPIRW